MRSLSISLALVAAAAAAIVVLPSNGSPSSSERQPLILVNENNLEWVDVSSKNQHTCGLTEDGDIYCWGCDYRDHGQCGHFPGDYIDIAVGAFNSCGLHRDGTVECWGCEGIISGTSEPVDADLCMTPGSAFTEIESGWNNVCGITTAGRVECWGSRGLSRAAINDTPGGTFTHIDIYNTMACASAEGGDLSCWGLVLGQQLDCEFYSTAGFSVGPHWVCGWWPDGSTDCCGLCDMGGCDVPPKGVTAVDSNSPASCGVTAQGQLRCWGTDYELLGAVPTGCFKKVANGVLRACAIRCDGSLYCWGWWVPGQTLPTNSE